jgi:hypothetical protein
MTDPFRHDDAAYVLGALDPAERAAFERHLATCPHCTERVRAMRAVVPALSTVPPEAFEPVPETLLPGLLRRAADKRRRGRYVLSGVAAAAVAGVITLAVTLWPGGGAPAAHRMTALVPTPVKASVALESKPWGTEIDLHCSYVGHVPAIPYLLLVRGRSGPAERLGTWRLVPGKETEYTSGTALRPDQITRVEIALPDGTPVLRLDV